MQLSIFGLRHEHVPQLLLMCTFLVGSFGYTCWTSKNHGVHYKKKSPLLLNTDTKFEFWCFKPNEWPYQSPLSEGLFQNIDRARALWGGLDWRAGTDMLLVAKPSFLPGGMKLAKLYSHTAHVHTRTNVHTHTGRMYWAWAHSVTLFVFKWDTSKGC